MRLPSGDQAGSNASPPFEMLCWWFPSASMTKIWEAPGRDTGVGDLRPVGRPRRERVEAVAGQRVLVGAVGVRRVDRQNLLRGRPLRARWIWRPSGDQAGVTSALVEALVRLVTLPPPEGMATTSYSYPPVPGPRFDENAMQRTAVNNQVWLIKALRSASAAGVGSTSNSSCPDGSVTTVSTARLSISGRATPASTGVTRPIQSEDSRGVSSGTGSCGRRRRRARRPSGRASPRR